jgi:hypothetical protein
MGVIFDKLICDECGGALELDGKCEECGRVDGEEKKDEDAD